MTDARSTEADLIIQVYGDAYLHEDTLIDGCKEHCMESHGDEKVIEAGDKLIKIEVTHDGE